MAEAKRICFDIDKELSGLLLRIYIRNGGYSVRQIQEYLYLSCPQPVDAGGDPAVGRPSLQPEPLIWLSYGGSSGYSAGAGGD